MHEIIPAFVYWSYQAFINEYWTPCWSAYQAMFSHVYFHS